jgi:hypothetical protein
MNVKRFVIACVVVFVVTQIIDGLIHMVGLASTYEALSHVWRPEADMMSKMWIMYVAAAVFWVLFCYIFTRGYENKGPMEGVRYGLLIGLLIGVPVAYNNYVVLPIPASLAHKWALASLVVSVVGGLVLALVYRPAETPAAAAPAAEPPPPAAEPPPPAEGAGD